jgi:hypothetical protein
MVTLLVAAAVIGMLILRNSQPRKLRVEFLWVRPVIILLGAGYYFSLFPPKTPVETAGLVAAFAIGAGLGWWRGGFTRIEVDPATQTATQQASLLGMLVIVGLFALRYLVRIVALQNPSALPVSPYAVVGWLLALAVGLIVLQQLEIWLRARRLIAAAQSA